MNEKKIISRRDAVKRIARRAGYPEYRAEEIAQESALSLIENEKLSSQTNFQSYIDSVRGDCEATYSRAGHTIRPVFSWFEADANTFDELRFEPDFEDREEYRRDIYDIVSASRILKKRYQVIWILYHGFGWTMDEISKSEGVSESRIYQLLAISQKRIKKKVIQTRLSQERERQRKLKKQKEVSREIQKMSDFQEKDEREMENIYSKKRFRVSVFEVKKISKSLSGAFGISAF